MLDWINCMLEFIAFLCIYFCFYTDPKFSFIDYCLYFLLGGIASVYFVKATTQLLPVNIAIYVAILLVSFRSNSILKNLKLAVCAIPFMLIFEFILHSLLPVNSLQTDIGNLLTNIVFIIIIASLLIYLQKSALADWVASFFIKRFYIILPFSIALVILGQVYLSRLAAFWSYLPGAITLLVFAAFLAIVYFAIKYEQSEDRLRSQVLEDQILNSESFVVSMRTQLHDYKHHIQHLMNQIQVSSDLSSLQEETTRYLTELDHDRSFYDQLIAIQQPVFRAALFGCFASCIKNDIPFQLITGDMLPSFPLKDYQLVEVIENLISNAIEHNLSLPVEKRFVLLTLSSDGIKNLFSIENPAEDITRPISDFYQNGISSKGGSHQGLGLSSIQKTLSEHGITFSGSHDYDVGSIRFEIIYESR